MKTTLPKAVSVLLLIFLSSLGYSQRENGVVQLLRGRWTMEDAYTFHAGSSGGVRIESHPMGEFTTELIFYGDGTGVLDRTGFSWVISGDILLWELDGRVVSILPRPLDEDTVLILATVDGDLSGGSAISILHRSE
ncbi:MAG: hypothetical protein ACOC45_07420 [Alkalispirochaetaceae bacterium]